MSKGKVVFTNEADALPPKKRYMRGRRLVVLDIENAVGHANLTCEEVNWVRERLVDLIGLTDGDQVVVGSSHVGLAAVGFGWPETRRVVRSGPDGADLALLEVLEERIAEKYDRLVLVSGDGIFADQVAQLASQGVSVEVLAHENGLSKRLRMAAGQAIVFGCRLRPGNFGGAA